MDRASGGSSMPYCVKNNILDFLRAKSMKIAVENGRSAKRQQWERDCRELVRFALFFYYSHKNYNDNYITKSKGACKYITTLRLTLNIETTYLATKVIRVM